MITYTADGRILEINGPRTDVVDVTVFEYYANDAGEGLNRGMLKKITNPLGHDTSFANYNGYGKPGQITDENSVVATIVYDAAGRLDTLTKSGYTWDFDYDDAGNLTALHLPGNRDIIYTYTDAHLVSTVEDTAGNVIGYTYDGNGNVTGEVISDTTGVLASYVNYAYDAKNRLEKIIYPGNHEETFGYDDAGNLTSFVDRLSNTTTYAYDALNRLEESTQPGSIVTAFGHDAHDNLSVVTDALENATTYSYDDFGRVVSESSQDTGTTTYTYDLAGNLLSRTDACGVTVTYVYDALNRLTNVHFPDSTQDITFTYDSGTNGTGRLTGMTDPAGTTTYEYNALGQLIRETRVMDSLQFVTEYNWDANGNLLSMTYPSNMEATITQDADDRITSVTADGQTLAQNVTYLPFGPASGYDLGSGLTLNNTYDESYRLTEISAGSIISYTYTRNAAGDVSSVSGKPKPSFTNETTAFSHSGNRLTEASGSMTAVYTHNDCGCITSDGTRSFTYNQNHRLVLVEEGMTTIAEYAYDGFGRRVKKVVSGTETTYYHYDANSRLIAETDYIGNAVREYVYLNGNPLAVKKYGDDAGWYYYLNDHLGTPQKLVDSTNQVVWSAAYLLFGEATVNAGSTIENHLRYQGQYFDEETGLHYNFHRYYDPVTGRYITPDPIGLSGGLNLYVYSYNDAINEIDPFGLWTEAERKWLKDLIKEQEIITQEYKRIALKEYENSFEKLKELLKKTEAFADASGNKTDAYYKLPEEVRKIVDIHESYHQWHMHFLVPSVIYMLNPDSWAEFIAAEEVRAHAISNRLLKELYDKLIEEIDCE